MAPVAVSVTLPPAQKLVGPLAVMLTVGVGLTETVTGEEVLLHPNALVALTVNVPELVTLIEALVALFDHR